MANALPYKIECRSTRPYFELIAAFDIQHAAEAYAEQCAIVNLDFTYRVKLGRRVLREFRPDGRLTQEIQAYQRQRNAAPELYDALKAAKDALRTGLDRSEALRKASRAIAKAEGRDQ